ncbi:MAG: hypothetical protein HY959_03715 [Ignavibacteriae bacterium]|nr:hypothetical protein [Ignavibacteriota bacterium]
MDLTKLRNKFNQKVFSDENETTVANTVIDDYLNIGYQAFLIEALSANGGWQINSNFYTANIVAGKHDVAFESSLLKVNEVYIKTRPTGDYIKAILRDVSTIISDPLTNYNPPTPEYDLTDKNLFFYIPEDEIVDVTEGIRIHSENEFTSLVNTTDEPKIPTAFLPFIYKYGAREYCQDNEMWNRVKSLDYDLEILKDSIKKFYAQRSEKRPLIMTFKKRNFR